MNKLLNSENAALPIHAADKKRDENNTILLIEHNAEMIELVVASLQDYQVIHGKNNYEGLQLTINSAPCLIISSIHEPATTNYNYYQEIRKDKRTHLIPVIFLINTTLFDSSLEELALAADDYIISPFSPGELRLRVKKTLNRQHQMFEMKVNEFRNINISDSIINHHTDQTLKDPILKNLYAKIEEKLDDSNFNVEHLATHLSMSKASLNRKLKSLTGLAPGCIIHHYRLQRAAQYLQQGYNSSETAYRTGFDSPAYFSKCFRKYYKLTPIKFSKQKQ